MRDYKLLSQVPRPPLPSPSWPDAKFMTRFAPVRMAYLKWDIRSRDDSALQTVLFSFACCEAFHVLFFQPWIY